MEAAERAHTIRQARENVLLHRTIFEQQSSMSTPQGAQGIQHALQSSTVAAAWSSIDAGAAKIQKRH
jgi:hypothetical protein